MKLTKRSLYRLLIAAVAFLSLIGAGVLISGQENSKTARTPMVNDWSTHHVVFSSPSTAAEALKEGRFDEWYKLRGNLRYQMAVAARNARAVRGAEGLSEEPKADLADQFFESLRAGPKPPPTKPKTKPQGDWSNYLGGTASAELAPTLYPAKYTWDLNAPPDCTRDYLVVPVNVAPASVANATGTIVINSDPSGGSTTITIGSSVYDWHNTTSLCVAAPQKCVDHTGTTTTDATNLANAIAGTCFDGPCAVDPAVTVSSVSSSTVNLQAIATGAAGNVALATNNTSQIHLNGVAQASSSLTGGIDGQASIVAFNNLYDATGTGATGTGTLTGNVLTPPASSSSVTINGVALTASDPTTAGNGSIAVGASFCFTSTTPGITLDGVTFQPATGAGVGSTGSFALNTATGTTTLPQPGEQVVIGGVTYTFESSLGGSTPNQVLTYAAGTSNGTTVRHNISANLGSAIDNTSSTCAYTSSSACFYNLSGTNPQVSSTTASSSSQTLTPLCLDNGTSGYTSSTNVTVTAVGAGSGGTAGTNRFALSTSNVTLASNIAGRITANTTTNAVVNVSAANGTVSLSAKTAGSTGNYSVGFSSSAITGVTLTNLSGGGDGSTSGTTFAYWAGAAKASTVTLCGNIVSAINTNTLSTLVNASGCTGSGPTYTISLTANNVGVAGDSITTTDNLADFSWGGGTLAGGADNGICGTGQPTVLWAYKTSTAGSASPMLGSPIISYLGDQVAFVESSSSGGAILHILHPGTATGNYGNTTLNGTPVAPATVTTSTDWQSCLSGTTACMVNLTLGSSGNSNSPPFYDYNTDTLWVGDNSGHLFEVTSVFNFPSFTGLPTVNNTAPWSSSGRTVGATGAIMTGPILDYGGSGSVLVADNGGHLWEVLTASSTNYSVPSLGAITDPPLTDPFTEHVYVFSGVGSGGNAKVDEYKVAAGGLSSPASESIGQSSATQVHAGMFDINYYNSANGTGNLYVCGKQSGNSAPALYKITMTSGAMTAVGTALNLTTNTTAGECSPLTELYNPTSGSGTDWLFVGVPANCYQGGSGTSGGCIISFNISSGSPVFSAAAGENGGTSGIIGDNISASSGASSVYFTTLTAPGAGGCTSEPSQDNTACVVKRTQSGLN